jgi:hypothetical protein
LRVVLEQARLTHRECVRARDGRVVGGERSPWRLELGRLVLQRPQPGLGQGLRRGHLLPVVVGLTRADHRRLDVAHLWQVALTRGSARLDDRGDVLIEQVDQHLRDLRRGGLVRHRVDALGHHRADDLFVVDLWALAPAGAVLERRQLALEDEVPVGALLPRLGTRRRRRSDVA